MDLIRFLDLRYFFNRILEIITGTGSGGVSFVERFLAWWESILPLLKVISTYLSLIFLTLAVYSYIRYKQVKAEEDRKFAHHYEPDNGDLPKDDRWQKILDLTDSDNPNDWRQAVLEADVILDELLIKEGFPGENLGEKLKSINSTRLASIDAAWEAHKVRNRIAHSGSDFVLTQKEAKRVISLFGVVFREFGYL